MKIFILIIAIAGGFLLVLSWLEIISTGRKNENKKDKNIKILPKQSPCSNCRGDGLVFNTSTEKYDKKCSVCNGWGFVLTPKEKVKDK